MTWRNFEVSPDVNTLHLAHDLNTGDVALTPPSIRSVTLSGNEYQFPNEGWGDSHLLFAVSDLTAFDLVLVLDFHDDDSVVDTLTLLFETRSGVTLSSCFAPEAMQVRRLLPL